MPNSLDEMSRRRRVVYHSLNPIAADHLVDAALELLEAEFSDGDFSCSRFLMRMRQISEGELNPNDAFARMMDLGKLTSREIGPDPRPFYGPTNEEPQRPIGPTRVEGAVRVFNTLVASLVSAAERRRGLESLTSFVSQSRDLRVSGMAMQQVLLWSKDPRHPITRLTKPEMADFVHRIYVWLCEAYGPQTADSLMQQALRRAEELPEAAEHSPRAFL